MYILRDAIGGSTYLRRQSGLDLRDRWLAGKIYRGGIFDLANNVAGGIVVVLRDVAQRVNRIAFAIRRIVDMAGMPIVRRCTNQVGERDTAHRRRQSTFGIRYQSRPRRNSPTA